MVYRVYVEKKAALANEARALLEDLRAFLGIESLTGLRLFNRYDLEGISRDLFDYTVKTVLSEPQLDIVTDTLPQGDAVFAVEYLPGQYDQRADSAAQCVQILSQGERPLVRTARVYALEGKLTDAEIAAIKQYVINPVESREASLELPETLRMEYDIPTTVRTVEGFTAMDSAALDALRDELGLAMDLDDLTFLQRYFRDDERREPTITEIRVVELTGLTTAATPPSPPTSTTWRSTIPRSRQPMNGIWPRAWRATAKKRPPSAPRRSWTSPPSAQRP